LLYAITHTWKHCIWEVDIDTGKQNEPSKIQSQAASVLWTLREQPHYLAYPNVTEQKLANLLGDMPTDPKVIGVLERGRGEGSVDDLYSYSRLAQSEDYGGKMGTAVRIPEMDDLVRQGVLTDVVSAAGRKILNDAMVAPHYKQLNEILATRAGISIEELQQHSVARLNYRLYTIGYLLPHMKADSESANFIEKQGLMAKIDDPMDYLKKNFGLEITV